MGRNPLVKGQTYDLYIVLEREDRQNRPVILRQSMRNSTIEGFRHKLNNSENQKLNASGIKGVFLI